MATKASGKHGTNKKKASARQNAGARVSERRGSGGAVKLPRSQKDISVGRFPGETPLTGEDRPARARGGKARGQSVAGVSTASGKGRARNGPTNANRKTGRAAPIRRGQPGSATR
jgi:hypothetical protein